MELNSKAIFVLFTVIFLVKVNAVIVNQNVERIIDLSTQLVKISLKISAEDLDGKTISEYVLPVPLNEFQNMAFVSATDAAKRNINFGDKIGDGHREIIFKFSTAAQVQKFQVDLVFSKLIIPHPVEIRQQEKQLVKYTGFLNLYSPYKTITQRTSVRLSQPNIISYTQVKPYSVSGKKIEYGPYEKIEAYTNQTLTVHYENQTPFLAVRHLERSIEISHWGNIAIKENIHIEHVGAKLKGPFSRYDFQKDGRPSQSAVKSYKTILPASANGVYYRDSNGNISTSSMKVQRDFVELELKPRFPLFGGWKTNYILGYNVPSFEYLFHKGDEFLLKMRFVDHIFDDMVIDKAVVKIILPEGATRHKLITPYHVTRSADELYYSYLDTVGRPTIVLSKTNLVENHISDFTLKYQFSTISLLQEMLLVIAFIFIIFIFTIIFLRLDFSITSSHHHKD